MLQEERSERSRTLILDAALELFSHRGYGATSMRDVAGKAGVSTGSVYHHFRDKEAIFKALLDQWRQITQRDDFPINVALRSATLLDDMTPLADAAHEVTTRWRAHVALFYVDAVEFDGQHLQEFYTGLARRFDEHVAEHRQRLRLDERIRDGIPPAAALLFVTRTMLYYSTVETLFNVPRQFGLDSKDAIQMMSNILRVGIVKQDGQPKG